MQLLTVTCMLATTVALLPPARFVQPRRHTLLRGADDDAAALLEAANKLRAEAAALETEAQAEAVALESARVEQQKAAAVAAAAEQKAAAATAALTPAATVAVATPGLAPSAFAGIDKSREAFVSTLSSLKEAGQATKWNSAALVADGAENPTEARVRAATGINGAKDLLSQEEVSNDQLGALTAGVFVVSAILAIASGALIGGNVGASFTYIFAVLPIVFLGVGSSSPGVIVALYGIVRGAAEDLAASERRRRHESAHLVAGYRLGLPVAEYSAGDRPRVEFYYKTGTYTRDDAEALACVALSGAVGECEAFGQAKGAQQDFADLQDIFDRVQPPLTPAEQQSATRRACLNAYGVLYGKRSRKDDAAVAAVDAAMARGATLGEVVCALENA
ncbi:unnamed protein product [Pelagomonas calceolata]|uniref:H(+)-exporting diphosphatase n=2 Tax=Pelagomonas calceolata TaxID=35677 RepID=A0A8J2WKW2_9STRA|nr:unnamed protein product [Pelagomonas calceolata]